MEIHSGQVVAVFDSEELVCCDTAIKYALLIEPMQHGAQSEEFLRQPSRYRATLGSTEQLDAGCADCSIRIGKSLAVTESG